MANACVIDSEEFRKFLTAHSFSEGLSNNEVVFSKEHPNKIGLFVKIYSSIRTENATARGVGEDAIRTVALFINNEKTYPIFKGVRVYRTTSQESVHSRVQDRIEKAFVRCNEWLEQSNKQTTSKTQPTQIGKHVGCIGDDIRLTVKVIRRIPYSNKFLFTMSDPKDDCFIYWTEKDLLQPNEMYSIRATIKNHNIFCGQLQTELHNVFGKRIVM